MDEQVKAALAELKATADTFSANVERWIAEDDVRLEEIARTVLEWRSEVAKSHAALVNATEALKCW